MLVVRTVCSSSARIDDLSLIDNRPSTIDHDVNSNIGASISHASCYYAGCLVFLWTYTHHFKFDYRNWREYQSTMMIAPKRTRTRFFTLKVRQKTKSAPFHKSIKVTTVETLWKNSWQTLIPYSSMVFHGFFSLEDVGGMVLCPRIPNRVHK